MKVCDYIVEFLAGKGVDTVFSIPGGGCIFLSDAFAREERIEMVANHHEQGCSISAEGYARSKNDLGVCLVTSGPGGSNAWTGTLCSYQDSVPVLVISGNVNRSMTTNYTGLASLRQLGDQEFNVVKTVSNFTKYAAQVNDPENIRYHLERAYHEAKSGRPGPVWLDIPLDVSTSKINPTELKPYTPEQSEEKKFDISEIISKLEKSKKPVILVGNGVRLSNSVEVLDKFLTKHKIPVVTSLNGKDNVDNNYEYNTGTFGVLGNISANKALQESDFVLSIGSRLYVRQIGYNFEGFAKNAFKVYVDIDAAELSKPTIKPDIKINLDAKEFLNILAQQYFDLHIDQWQKTCKKYIEKFPNVLDRHRNKSPINMYGAMEKLNKYMSERITVVTSNGSANVVAMQVLKLYENQRMFTNKATAPMGYGLPAAIGSCYADRGKKVICLDGDGSVHMNIQELQVLKQNNLPIKLIIFNNNGYLSIKMTQTNYCEGKLSLSTPSSGLTLPKYKKIAYAYGIKYHSASSEEQMNDILDKVFLEDYEGPEIVEIFVDPDGIHEPKVKASLGEDGKFIPGKLEDISWQ
jgi:acetolactate synthase I/II/III large subunit